MKKKNIKNQVKKKECKEAREKKQWIRRGREERMSEKKTEGKRKR